MADTKRSLSQLLTQLFQDGQSEGISAQDIRDLVVSLQPAHADCYVTTPAASVVTVAGTYVKGAGTTTFHDDSLGFDAGGESNRLRYTGMIECHACIRGSVSLTCNQNNRIIGLKIYHYDASAGTGSVLAKGNIRQAIGTGSDVISMPIDSDVHLDTNDYIEIWVTDETGASSVTLNQMYLSATGVLV